MINDAFHPDDREEKLKTNLRLLTEEGNLDVSVYVNEKRVKLEDKKVHIFYGTTKLATLWVDDKNLVQGHVSDSFIDDLVIFTDQAIVNLEPFRKLREGQVL